jgi:hypothetical protein
MSIVPLSRAQLLKQLNERFSEAEIKNTARIINKLPARAELGAISVALGIIPRGGLAQWRKATGRVPVIIADALVQGIRGHMRAIGRTKGTRYAGSKAIKITIVDGKMFGLSIAQEMSGMRIRLTMRNQPLPPAS